VRIRPGEEVPPLASHRARAGVVLATGATREEAVGHAQRAVAGIAIEMAPNRMGSFDSDWDKC
jgi:hypothetical protein